MPRWLVFPVCLVAFTPPAFMLWVFASHLALQKLPSWDFDLDMVVGVVCGGLIACGAAMMIDRPAHSASG